MKQNILSFLYLFVLLGLSSSTWSFTATTTNVTSLLLNSDFSSGSSNWSAITTPGQSEVIFDSVNGIAKLRCYTGGAVVFLQSWNNSSTLANIVDFSANTIMRDEISVKVWLKGSGDNTYSPGTIAGAFAIGLNGALALPWSWDTLGFPLEWGAATGLSYSNYAYDSEIRVTGGFSSDTNNLWGTVTSWTILGITFTPIYQDWWQLRNIQLVYVANQNQPVAGTEIWIDKIEIDAIVFSP